MLKIRTIKLYISFPNYKLSFIVRLLVPETPDFLAFFGDTFPLVVLEENVYDNARYYGCLHSYFVVFLEYMRNSLFLMVHNIHVSMHVLHRVHSILLLRILWHRCGVHRVLPWCALLFLCREICFVWQTNIFISKELHLFHFLNRRMGIHLFQSVCGHPWFFCILRAFLFLP